MDQEDEVRCPWLWAIRRDLTISRPSLKSTVWTIRALYTRQEKPTIVWKWDPARAAPVDEHIKGRFLTVAFGTSQTSFGYGLRRYAHELSHAYDCFREYREVVPERYTQQVLKVSVIRISQTWSTHPGISALSCVVKSSWTWNAELLHHLLSPPWGEHFLFLSLLTNLWFYSCLSVFSSTLHLRQEEPRPPIASGWSHVH